MGYGTRDARGTSGIRTFTPDDTEDCFWIPAYMEPTLEDILNRAANKWHFDCRGSDAINDALSMIQITSEHIHTDCLGYDQYDSLDYQDYLKITLLK